MKRKIIAMITVLMVGAGAGIYAVSGSAYSARTAVPQRTAAAVETAASAAAAPSSTRSAAALVRNAASASPAQKARRSNAASATAQANSVRSKCTSAASKAKAASSAAPVSAGSQTNGCSVTSCAAKQTCVSNSCTSGTSCPTGNCTQNLGCGTIVVASGSGSNASYYEAWLQNLLQSLKNRSSCSRPSTSAPVSSKPSAPVSSKPTTPASSKPASSSPASSNGGTYSAFQNEVVRLVNVQRANYGLKALSVNAAITKTATLKSQDMAAKGYFDHTSPTYGSPFDMMKQFGISYRSAGENIAYGQTSPAQVMDGWMNSPGHRANILNSSYTQIGVGVARNANGTYYWTQHFIG